MNNEVLRKTQEIGDIQRQYLQADTEPLIEILHDNLRKKSNADPSYLSIEDTTDVRKNGKILDRLFSFLPSAKAMMSNEYFQTRQYGDNIAFLDTFHSDKLSTVSNLASHTIWMQSSWINVKETLKNYKRSFLYFEAWHAIGRRRHGKAPNTSELLLRKASSSFEEPFEASNTDNRKYQILTVSRSVGSLIANNTIEFTNTVPTLRPGKTNVKIDGENSDYLLSPVSHYVLLPIWSDFPALRAWFDNRRSNLNFESLTKKNSFYFLEASSRSLHHDIGLTNKEVLEFGVLENIARIALKYDDQEFTASKKLQKELDQQIDQ